MSKFNSTEINISKVKLNSMGIGCSLLIGNIHSMDKSVINKRNQGFGEQNADGVIRIGIRTVVEDSDMDDINIIKNKKFRLP